MSAAAAAAASATLEHGSQWPQRWYDMQHATVAKCWELASILREVLETHTLKKSPEETLALNLAVWQIQIFSNFSRKICRELQMREGKEAAREWAVIQGHCTNSSMQETSGPCGSFTFNVFSFASTQNCAGVLIDPGRALRSAVATRGVWGSPRMISGRRRTACQVYNVLM